jgi:hypothetical protein
MNRLGYLGFLGFLGCLGFLRYLPRYQNLSFLHWLFVLLFCLLYSLFSSSKSGRSVLRAWILLQACGHSSLAPDERSCHAACRGGQHKPRRRTRSGIRNPLGGSRVENL